jgi:multidrug efflux pump subunit AcrA (membrane-fusion protein)
MKVSDLFRKQAVENASKRLEGSVILINVPSFRLLSCFLVFTVLTGIVFIANSTFSSYERVEGILKSVGGELKVYPSKTGVVQQLFVHEGQEVKVGDSIGVIRTSVSKSDGQSEEEREKLQIEAQIQNLVKQKQFTVERYKLESKRLKSTLLGASQRLESVEQQLALNAEHLQINQKLLRARTLMHKTGNVTNVEVESARIEVLTVKGKAQQYQAEVEKLKTDIERSQNDLSGLPTAELSELASLDNDISALKRQLIKLENQIEILVQARQPGIITNINAPEGELAHHDFPLLSIASLDRELIAELYVPARARAFIADGQSVFVRFDAFPHQFYGDLHGKVYEVSNMLLFPSDWPNPLNLKQPVYRVKVKLDSQAMLVAGEPVNLQQGLFLDADIVLERRTILDYLISPILEIKNNLR